MIRVLIVAHSIVVQAGLAALIAANPDFSIAGTSTHLTSEQILTLEPDVILMEFDGLEEDATVTFRQLASDLADIALALLVDSDIDSDLESIAISELLQTHVRAILPSTATTTEIITTLAAIATGLTVLHPDFLPPLLLTPPSLPPVTSSLTPSHPHTLTPREIEVLTMLAEGLGNKAIAKRLQISEHTVKFHVGSLFSKLNASSRTEAVTLGARMGLILL